MPRAERTGSTRPERRPGSRRRAPAVTTILLVRHGTTTTTGKELPGRAPGLHLADEGRRQADDVAARIGLLAHPPAPAAPAEPAGNGSRGTAGDGSEAPAKPQAPRGLPIAAVYASP